MNIQEVRAKFPQYSDLSDGQLADALHSKFYADMPRAEFDAKIGLAAPAKDTSLGTAGALKAGLYGILKGLRDPVDAAAQMLERGVKEAGVDTGAINKALGMPSADEATQAAETAYNEAWKGAPPALDVNRLAGNVIATAPIAAGVPAGASLGARMASGAASGSLAGELQPTQAGIPDEQFWSQKADQAKLGLTVGAAAPAVAAGIGRALSPKALPAQTQQLVDEGIPLTPGQLLGGAANRIEERAMSIPLVGDSIAKARNRSIEGFNRAAVNKALAPIGEKLNMKTPLGREAVNEAYEKISRAYDKIAPKLAVQADDAFTAKMTELADMATQLPKERADQFAKIVDEQIIKKFGESGVMTGPTFKEVESTLGRLAAGYRGSPDYDVRRLGDALLQTNQNLRELLFRNNPKHAAELKSINSAYNQFLRVQTAASRVGAADGVFTPAQLTSAVRQLDKSLRKSAFAKGGAPMQEFAEAGKNVIGSKVPDSGTAGRAAQIMAGLGAVTVPGGIPAALAAGGGAAALYSPTGISALQALLTRRPEFLRQAGQGLLDAAPYAALVAPQAASGLLSVR